MTLNSSGPISLAGTTAGVSIEIENGGNGTTQISLNDGAVRTLAGVTTPNSTITMPTNFYGKSNRVAVTVTLASSTQNYTWNKCKVPGYSAGKTCATLKINSGVYVYSSSTGSQALTISTAWTSGDAVKIINCGYIIGMGGNGGNASFGGSGGGGGGTAILAQYPVSITNNNTVGGGGGGGGGGGASGGYDGEGGFTFQGGGGGGGGRTGLTNSGGGCGTCGRNGGAGTSSSAGGGGSACYPGGSGGNWGSGGFGGANGSGPAGSFPGFPGGGAGPATSGNSFITWTVTGTRYGPLG